MASSGRIYHAAPSTTSPLGGTAASIGRVRDRRSAAWPNACWRAGSLTDEAVATTCRGSPSRQAMPQWN